MTDGALRNLRHVANANIGNATMPGFAKVEAVSSGNLDHYRATPLRDKATRLPHSS